jgi:hypothetical protein
LLYDSADNRADFDVTAYAAENARLAEVLREARPAFEFLCAAWPEAFMAQASEALARLGLPRLRTPASPSTNGQRGGRGGSDDESDDERDEEGAMSERAHAATVSFPEKLTAKKGRHPERPIEELIVERRYTTKDFTAPRAFVQRIPPAVIARTYYDPDEDVHAATPGAMERHLTAMLDALVALALAHGAAALAEHLRASIRQHGRPLLNLGESEVWPPLCDILGL